MSRGSITAITSEWARVMSGRKAVASRRPSGSGAKSPSPSGRRWNVGSAPPGEQTKFPRLEMQASFPSGSGAGLP
ncbi:MAG: hypothetical protein A2V98_09350 [Planctomycetes bacterium RBG_16_64_12]|nr:MAG: hypothetical protein A2V98_09350 [Planctomycetes bacterium RBG_16_64_12]